jgi:hypothetical protein
MVNSQNGDTQYGAVLASYFEYCLFSVPLRPPVELKRIGFCSSLVWQLFRVTTVEHEIGGDVNEPKIMLDSEGSKMPWNTRIQLCGRTWI